MSYRAIGEVLGVTHPTVRKWCNEWLEEYHLQTEEDHQAARSESIARLDAAIAGLAPGVESGDPQSVAQLVKIEQLRAKLLGIEAPAKVETTGTVTIKIGL